MLPTTRPNKKLSIFTGSIFPSGQQQEPDASAEPAPTSGRGRLLRTGVILLVSLILAVAFIVWGPSGDFVGGRAFTVSPVPEPIGCMSSDGRASPSRLRLPMKSRTSSTTGL